MTESPATGPASHRESTPASPPATNQWPWFEGFASRWLPLVIVTVGFAVRIIPASRLFLNPDEALHNLLASQPSISRAWAAALTNAHPPLLILLLYYWRQLGDSAFWLRLPSILAGTAACWFLYKWLRLVSDRFTALLGLLLACFAPSLILLSAEIRQYALLIFFISACLYFSESAVQRGSPRVMAVSAICLWGALLTHYSALMFAFALGLYMLVRLHPYRQHAGLFLTWAGGQIVGIAIAAYFLLTHIPSLKETGMVRADLESYLRKSVFHPGQRNPAEFVAAQTLRVFTYLFSHGLIGTLMMLAFIGGLIWLIRNRFTQRHSGARPPATPELAALLLLPFVVNWAVALAGLYPLGATRHSSFLAPFAIAGISIGISLAPGGQWLKAIVVLVALLVCNLFPAPPPPIRAKDQAAAHMQDAVAYLRTSAPARSAILTDYESGLLLGYYVCGQGVVQLFPPQQPFARAQCGEYTSVATSFREWKFSSETFPREIAEASKLVPAGKETWLFYAGWINDSAPALKKELRQFGCPEPHSFGENILICRLANPEGDKPGPSQQ